jgi:hypothetical protein
MSVADSLTAGLQASLARVTRRLGPEGAVRNAAQVLDERDRVLTDLEHRLAGITVSRPTVSDVA